MDIDLILCGIVTDFLQVSPDRVVVEATTFKPSNDKDYSVIIRTLDSSPVGTTRHFDQTTLEEVLDTVRLGRFRIDVMSYNRSAYEIKNKIIAGLNSSMSLAIQREYHIKIFRGVRWRHYPVREGAKFLYRVFIFVSVWYNERFLTGVDYYEVFREPTLLTNG